MNVRTLRHFIAALAVLAIVAMADARNPAFAEAEPDFLVLNPESD